MITVEHILNTNTHVLTALQVVQQLDLQDCWIGAGFIRNRVWDYLHGLATPIEQSDVDVIFYDNTDTSLEYEKAIENKLNTAYPHFPWSVKNQARMKLKYNHNYSTSFKAISFWPETATCIAARLNNHNTMEIIAPYGCDDLLNLILRPSPNIDPSVFINRIQEKNWLKVWTKLKVVM